MRARGAARGEGRSAGRHPGRAGPTARPRRDREAARRRPAARSATARAPARARGWRDGRLPSCRSRGAHRGLMPAYPEVLMTIRSPGSTRSGRSVNLRCRVSPSGMRTARSRTESRPQPSSSGGAAASASAGRDSATALTAAMPPTRRPRSGRSAARLRSGRAGPARARRGSGSSEMSSPGTARWCISVRMSPGSTA